MNNAAFRKAMENMRKHRDIKLATNEARRNYLVSGPNYHNTNCFSKNLLAIPIKTQILINKLVYLGLSISELTKIVMHESWYDYIKPK